MNNRMHQRTQELRPSERGAVPAHALPVNHRFDLSQFLLPEALDDEATERWIAHQQLPRQLRGLGLEFALHDVLRRRWRRLREHLSAGLTIVELEDTRKVRISDVLFFHVGHDSQTTEAGAVDGNCLRWFSFNVVRPFFFSGIDRAPVALGAQLRIASSRTSTEPNPTRTARRRSLAIARPEVFSESRVRLCGLLRQSAYAAGFSAQAIQRTVVSGVGVGSKRPDGRIAGTACQNGTPRLELVLLERLHAAPRTTSRSGDSPPVALATLRHDGERQRRTKGRFARVCAKTAVHLSG